MRPFPTLLAVLLSALFAPAALGHDGHGSPLAPVDVEIEIGGPRGGPVEVRYQITARQGLLALEAEVQLVHGGRILEQSPLVTGPTPAGDVLWSNARVVLPEDGARHQVEVLVRAVADGAGGGIPFSLGVLEAVGEGSLPLDAPLVEARGRARRQVPARQSVPRASTGSAALVVGRMLYEDREEGFNGWTGQWPLLPIRRARLELVDASSDTVLATGETDLDGHFALPLPGVGVGVGDLVVRCDAVCDAFGAPLTAADTALAPYRVSSATQAGWDLSQGLDLGDTVALRVKSGQKYGNPFDQLDQLVSAVEYLTHLGETEFQSGIFSLWPGGTQSLASTPYVFLSTDDGYDDSVLLHEVGHIIADFFSDDDHSGGSHAFGESDQGPSLSLGEGYATFFGCAVKLHAGQESPGQYVDLRGNLGSGLSTLGLRLRLEDGVPWASATGGEADEVAVACSLWNWIDTATTDDGDALDDDPLDGSWTFPGGIDADAALWEAYTGPTVLAADGVTVVDLWNGLFLDGFATDPATLAACFEEWKIHVRPDLFEPDNTLQQATAVTLGQWSAGHTLYRGSPAEHPVPGDGDEDWFRFESTGLERFSIETR